MNPHWHMSHGLGWNCHACGSFTADGAGIGDIERDCLNKVCWSLRAATNEADSDPTMDTICAADRFGRKRVPSMDDMQMLRDKLKRYPTCRVVISREAATRIIARTSQLETALNSLIREAQAVADDHHRPRYFRLDEALTSARSHFASEPGTEHG